VLANVRIVLVRPRGAANLGAVARAMKNMGLSDLVLVEPGPMPRRAAAAWAVHAADILDRRRTVSTLAEAVADCGRVVGTTTRGGRYRARTLTPRAAAPQLLREAAQQRLALIFGPEDHGLSNEDLKQCQQLLAIPAAPRYPSLNLAQAVMVCAYELYLVSQPSPPADGLTLAEAGRVDFMYRRLQEALLRIGFLPGDNPDHLMFALRRLLGRAGLEEADVRVLLGIARQIAWYGAGGWREAERRLAAGEPVK
jgi:tRNA/rRNA methyltransferase